MEINAILDCISSGEWSPRRVTRYNDVVVMICIDTTADIVFDDASGEPEVDDDGSMALVEPPKRRLIEKPKGATEALAN